MTVDKEMNRAFTVSADHLLCRYDFAKVLSLDASISNDAGRITSYSTKQIGNASLATSSDGKVIAVGGWDGKSVLLS